MSLKGRRRRKDCLVQGVNQFLDSALEQLEQENGKIIEEKQEMDYLEVIWQLYIF